MSDYVAKRKNNQFEGGPGFAAMFDYPPDCALAAFFSLSLA